MMTFILYNRKFRAYLAGYQNHAQLIIDVQDLEMQTEKNPVEHPDLNINWPIKKLTLSDKDKINRSLKDLFNL